MTPETIEVATYEEFEAAYRDLKPGQRILAIREIPHPNPPRVALGKGSTVERMVMASRAKDPPKTGPQP